VLRKAPPTLAVQPATINGQPGIISYADGNPLNVLTLDVADGRIKAVRIVSNPEKLRSVPSLRREGDLG
jgi:RNA polymerase sigma-70 factor (ECF subfamily)